MVVAERVDRRGVVFRAVVLRAVVFFVVDVFFADDFVCVLAGVISSPTDSRVVFFLGIYRF